RRCRRRPHADPVGWRAAEHDARGTGCRTTRAGASSRKRPITDLMATKQLRVRPTREPLRGSVPVASDPDILERALLFAALSNGECRFEVPRPPASWERCVEALRALGVDTRDVDQGQWLIAGVGL